MNHDRVEEILKAIEFADYYRSGSWQIDWVWAETTGDGSIPIARFRIQYVEPDVETGEPELQYGRWWYVEDNFKDEDVVRAAWLAVTVSDEHRRREGFLVDGERLFNPHKLLVHEGAI